MRATGRCSERCATWPTSCSSGRATVRAEGYGPPRPRRAAAAERRRARGQGDRPAIAVVSRSLDLTGAERLLDGAADATVLVLTTSTADPGRAEALRTRGTEVVAVGDDGVDVGRALDLLHDRGWSRVLCEGGPRLNGQLLATGRVDEVFVTVAPLVVGGPGRPDRRREPAGTAGAGPRRRASPRRRAATCGTAGGGATGGRLASIRPEDAWDTNLTRYLEAVNGLTSLTKASAERLARQLVQQGEVATDQVGELVSGPARPVASQPGDPHGAGHQRGPAGRAHDGAGDRRRGHLAAQAGRGPQARARRVQAHGPATTEDGMTRRAPPDDDQEPDARPGSGVRGRARDRGPAAAAGSTDRRPAVGGAPRAPSRQLNAALVAELNALEEV